jgi:hypothetical protein
VKSAGVDRPLIVLTWIVGVFSVGPSFVAAG